MPRVKSTLFRPTPGTTYVVVNTKTNVKTVCRVLRTSDVKKYGAIRSGRSCRRGEEFFKVFIGDKVYKMNNSLNIGICLSDDKVWEFTGEKPECAGKRSRKPRDKAKKIGKMAKPNRTKNIEFVSSEALTKIIKGI